MLKNEKIAESIKSVLTVFLLVVLVCLCFVYMLSYQNTGEYEFTKDTMETLSGESIKYQYANYLDVSLVSPKFIGFSAKALGDNIGFHCLGGANEKVYASVFRFYEKLFGEDGTVTPISTEEGEALFLQLLKKDYIYVVYENDLPKSLIYTMNEVNVTMEGVSGEYIRELLIVPGQYLYDGVNLNPDGMQVYTSIYSFYAIARDSQGNYYRYTTDFVPSMPSDVSFNTNLYLTYTTAESYFSYEFAGLWKTDDYFDQYGFSEKVTNTTAVFAADSGSFVKRTISVYPVSPRNDKMDAILGVFMMNPEKVSSYTEESGMRFYYDEGRNVSISPSGHLEYTAYGSEGLLLADLFDYHVENGTYDMLDYVGASLMLIRSLETVVSGGQSYPHELILSGVYYDGKTVTVTFGYALEGLPIYFEGLTDIFCLNFENGMLKGVSYELKSFSVFRGASVQPDMVWDLRVQLAECEIKREYAYAYYFHSGQTSGTVTLVGK